MNPRTEQEIFDLLQTGQITQAEAQMYRSQLNSNNPFGNIFGTPDRRSSTGLGQSMSTIPNQFPALNSETGQVQGNSTNIFGDIWTGNNNMPTNPYSQDTQYTIFNGSPTNTIVPIQTSEVSGSNSNLSLSDRPTREQWIQYQNQQGYDSTTAGENWDEVYGNKNMNSERNGRRGFPIIYPGGSDISTELYSLGRGIGAPKGSTGKNAMIVGSAGAALFDISRNIASGVGYENMNKYADQWYRDQQFGGSSRNYVAAPQYQNNNYLGGFYGEDGGFSEQPEQTQDPNQNQQILQQIASQVTQALQQGQTPQEIVKVLISKGIPQQQAVQLVQQVMKHMQQMTQQSPQEEQQEGQNSNPQEESQETPMMKNGGRFKHKVGDEISFSHEGKKVSGVISKIEGGKIYLK